MIEGIKNMFDLFESCLTQGNGNKTSKTVKYETYEDGNLKRRIERVWENGELVKDIDTANKQLDTKQEKKSFNGSSSNTNNRCKCQEKQNDCQCSNSFEQSKEFKEVEAKFVEKLKLIEIEVDKLRNQLSQSQKLNDDLISKNRILREKLAQSEEEKKEMYDKFETLRKFIG